MSKKNRNNGGFFHNKQVEQQAKENAEQGDKLEQALKASIEEPTVEQVQAKVAEELEQEDATPVEEPKMYGPELPPGFTEAGPIESKPLTEVEPSKGLTPEQVEVAKALVPGKIERYPDRLRKSTQPTPVKLVHAIAESMLKIDPSTRRKDIVNFCVSQGIAFYTARTQVQVYLNAVKRDREQAAKQAAEQAAKNHAA